MCEISRSMDNLQDEIYSVKSQIRDIETDVHVDTSSFENEVYELNKKFNLLAELFLKLAGQDVYRKDKKDKRKNHRTTTDKLASAFDVHVGTNWGESQL